MTNQEKEKLVLVQAGQVLSEYIAFFNCCKRLPGKNHTPFVKQEERSDGNAKVGGINSFEI